MHPSVKPTSVFKIVALAMLIQLSSVTWVMPARAGSIPPPPPAPPGAPTNPNQAGASAANFDDINTASAGGAEAAKAAGAAAAAQAQPSSAAAAPASGAGTPGTTTSTLVTAPDGTKTFTTTTTTGTPAAAGTPAAGGKDADSPSEATKKCTSAMKTANAVCNTMSMVGVSDPAQGAMMQMMINQAMTQAATIATSGANQAQQCKTQGEINELMGGINAIKGAACLEVQSTCEDTCEKSLTAAQDKAKSPDSSTASQGKTDVRNIEKAQEKCKAMTMNAMMSFMQAMQNGAGMLQDKACAAATAAATPPPAYTLGASTAVDCTDPSQAMSNVTCICAANPAASVCPGATAGSLAAPGTAVSSSGPGSVPRPYDQQIGTEGTPDPGLGKVTGTSGANVGQGGGSGGGAFGAGAGSGAGGGTGEDQGGAAAGDKGSIISGQGGGGGGGSNGAPGNPNGSAANGGAGGFFDKFNLSKFLPKKADFKNRGLAGMSVNSRDGITGPMGPSIWEKVTNQYQTQKPRLIQDR